MRVFLWQKRWLKGLFLSFSFLLSLFFFLFILIDLSLNGTKLFLHSFFSIPSFLFYYLCQFGLYLDLFLPVSFLLTLIYFLTKKKSHLEIAALQIAGFSKKALFFPFFLVALTLSIFLYSHLEWSLPYFAQHLQTFSNKKKQTAKRIFTLPLQDGSRLIFEKHNPSSHKILDAFWIKSPEEIWHIQTLSTEGEKNGFYADCFFRNKEDFLEKTTSLEKIKLPPFSIPKKLFFLPMEFQPLSLLYLQAKKKTVLFEEDSLFLYTYLLHKTLSPLIFPLIAFGCFPFSVAFQRKKNYFSFYAFSLFSFIFFEAFSNSLTILSENGILSPFWASFSPYGIAFFLFSFFYLSSPLKKRIRSFSLKRKSVLSMV